MNGPSPAPPARGAFQLVVAAFIAALVFFTALCVRDAARPDVRPADGGTFAGTDVDGRVVQVHLFEQGGTWQGWLYREGLVQTDWFSTSNRVHPWQENVFARERDDQPNPPESVVASTADARKLNATLPRLSSWGTDTANLSLKFGHLSFRRLTGLRLGAWGGTQEFRAQFPQLPDGSAFHAAISREIQRHCEREAKEFTSDPMSFWRDNLSNRGPMTLNQHELTEHWQLRLLTTNLASFCVWSYDATGGNGNHNHWQGVNYSWESGTIRPLKLEELFPAGVQWADALRRRCESKLAAGGAPDLARGAVTNADTDLSVFTLSPTGLQIYFNPYTIASGADGEFVVHFDYAELKDLLRSGGTARFPERQTGWN